MAKRAKAKLLEQVNLNQIINTIIFFILTLHPHPRILENHSFQLPLPLSIPSFALI